MRIDGASKSFQQEDVGTCSKKELEDYLKTIDSAIEGGQQLSPSTAASSDKSIVKPLLELANSRKPGLNASFCQNPIEMAGKIKSFIRDKKDSARFVVNMGNDGVHFAAFDYMFKGEHVSVIGVEPATIQGMGAAMLTLRTMSVFKRELPSVSIAVVESDLQRSSGECGIFSFSLVKKMFKEKDSFLELHHKNIQGKLPTNECGLVSVNNANKLLPTSFLKHSQSPGRLNTYLIENPDSLREPCNKKGETLKDRQDRHLVEIKQNGKLIKYSNSIEMKRKLEVENLLQSLNDK